MTKLDKIREIIREYENGCEESITPDEIISNIYDILDDSDFGERVSVALPDGHRLVAELSSNRDFPYVLYVGLEDESGSWVQELMRVGNAYTLTAGDTDPKYLPGVFDAYVWADPYDEDYTDEFTITEFKDESEAD